MAVATITAYEQSVRGESLEDDPIIPSLNKLSVSLLANHPLPVLPSPGWTAARNLRINWGPFAMAHLMTDEQAELLEKLCAAKRVDYFDLVKSKLSKYEETFKTVLANVQNPDATQQLLTVIHDCIYDNTILLTCGKHIEVFMKLLTRADDYTRGVSSVIICKLLVGDPRLQQEVLTRYVSWLADDIVNKPAATSNMQLLLRRPDFREIAFHAGAVTAIGKGVRSLLTPVRHLQAVYELCVSAWLLSFDAQVCPRMNDDSDIVRILCDVVRVIEKEKVIRPAIATLRNLSAHRQHTSFIITCEGDRAIHNAAARQFKDVDIIDDLKIIQENLAKDLTTFGNMDQYKSELNSGALVWSPVHRNDKFWQENHVAFEDNDKFLLRKLLALLSSQESTTVAVACFDVGEFVRFHPRGKKIVESLNGKEKIMGLMTHQDLEIRKQALLAVQKLMVRKWDLMAIGSGGK